MVAELVQVLQYVGGAVAVYVAIRVDIARLTVRVDHLERDIYPGQRQ